MRGKVWLLMLKYVPIHLNRDGAESKKWLAKEGNKRDLKQFLSLHGIDVNDVVEVDFSHLNFKPLVMVRGEDGKPVVDDDNYSVKCERRTVKYLCEKPTFK